MTEFSKNTIVFDAIPSSKVALPSTAKQQKIFLDAADATLKIIDYAGAIKPLGSVNVVADPTLAQKIGETYKRIEAAKKALSEESQRSIAELRAKLEADVLALSQSIDDSKNVDDLILAINDTNKRLSAIADRYVTSDQLQNIKSAMLSVADVRKLIPDPLSCRVGTVELLPSTQQPYLSISKVGSEYVFSLGIPYSSVSYAGGGISEDRVRQIINDIGVSGTSLTSSDGSVIISPIAGGYDLSAVSSGIAGSYVATVNGMSGDVFLDIPSISGLASEIYTDQAATAALTAANQYTDNAIDALPDIPLTTITADGSGLAIHQIGVNNFTIGITGSFGDASLRSEVELITAGLDGRVASLEAQPVPDWFLADSVALSGSLVAVIETKSDLAHTHDISGVSSLQSALDAKLNVSAYVAPDIFRAEVVSASGSLAAAIADEATARANADAVLQSQISDMTSNVFLVGSVVCSAGISSYNVTHASLDVASTYALAQLTAPGDSKPLASVGISNRTDTQFTLSLDTAPLESGYTINYLISDGKNPVISHGISDIQIFTANGTWTAPSGTGWQSVTVIAFGGGQGGASGRTTAASASSTGGAGGNGAWGVQREFAFDSMPTSAAVIVGAGGAGGMANGTTSSVAGGIGGDTTFAGNLVVAYSGGTGAALYTLNIGRGTGGAGGVGSNGSVGGAGFGASGGGGGSGIAAGTPGTANSGGAGGYAWGANTPNRAIGGTAAGGLAGGGMSAYSWWGGGGGGGGASSVGVGGLHCNGAGGGAYGGGGGGGGSVRSGNAGNGGAGADGICVVITRR